MARDGFHTVSMQAIAREAGVSAGLTYRYFTDKHDLLLAVLVDVLEEFGRDLPGAVAAHDDPVRGLVAGFRAYCRVIDRHRAACVLAYRETATLDHDGRDLLKRMEIDGMRPLVDAAAAGQAAGLLSPACDPELVAHDLIVLGQAWALKFWHFTTVAGMDRYIDHQVALMLGGLIAPGGRSHYTDLLSETTGGQS